MSNEPVQAGLAIGSVNDPWRLIARKRRIEQSIERADGARLAALSAELAKVNERLAAVRAALDAAR